MLRIFAFLIPVLRFAKVFAGKWLQSPMPRANNQSEHVNLVQSSSITFKGGSGKDLATGRSQIVLVTYFFMPHFQETFDWPSDSSVVYVKKSANKVISVSIFPPAGSREKLLNSKMKARHPCP
jgi:hypothetical protein